MTENDPSARLRAALDRLRELRLLMTPGPWAADTEAVIADGYSVFSPREGGGVARHAYEPDAALIVTQCSPMMLDAIKLALTRGIESTEFTVFPGEYHWWVDHEHGDVALRFADAILGKETR